VVISRRHLHLVIALLLPLMVLRAMLPAGYMPVAENGTLRITMCSDGFQPAATDQSGDQRTGNGDHQLPSNSGDCPFANAAVNAPPPAVSQSIVTIESDAGTAPASAAPARTVSIVRVQSARGPPSLSL
jgi:hypothetical protein